MNAIVVLEWKFSPRDYFEESIEISRDDYMMTIVDGQVHAKIDSATFEAAPDMRHRLHEALNDRFLGVQLLTHRAYELSRPTAIRMHADGRRDIFVELESASIVMSGGTVDFQVADKDGNVIADSKRDRIEKKKRLAELVTSHRATDALLVSLLQSHSAAVRDPNNELVHLYEIREALSTRFGGENATLTALCISAPQWSRLGHLCNNEPLRQGRHRGKAGGALRDATEDELTEVRASVRGMIEAYLQYLEASASP
jgi:hypothetical protein